MILTSQFNHTAKQPNLCSACHRPIYKGDRIEWRREWRGQKHAVCGPEGKAIKEEIKKSYASDSSLHVPCPVGLSYLPYQRAGIEFALRRKNTLIADDMGLGKTIQAIGFINAMADGLEYRVNGHRYPPNILVVCPASLKINWLYELEKWIVSPNLSMDIFPGEANIQVINYDQLGKIDFARERINGGRYWDLLIGDEAQYIKNPDSARSKLFKSIAANADRTILLTGTPILAHVADLWPLVQICAPEMFDKDKDGAGHTPFLYRYCDPQKMYSTKVYENNGVRREVKRYVGTSYNGATNLEELQEKLRSTCMVRRLKKDVLKELPPKRRQIIVMAGTKDDEDGYSDWVSDDWDTAIRQLRSGGKIPFEEISKKRHEQGLRKTSGVIKHVRECLENGIEKIILFAHHTDVIQSIYEALEPDYYAVVLTGSTSVSERQNVVEIFQNNPKCNIFIGSITAAGVGVTLTASSLIIFAEEDWNPSVITQAEDRAHRIGQTDSLLIQHLVTDKTIDVKMVNMLVKKQDIADKALDRDTMSSVSHRKEGG